MKRERVELIVKAIKVFMFLHKDWASAADVEAGIGNVTPQHIRQVLKRLQDEDGTIQRRVARNYVQYQWVGPHLEETEVIKVPPEDNKPIKAPAYMGNVAPPRTYVNGSMPNGDESYWKSKTTWGRT